MIIVYANKAQPMGPHKTSPATICIIDDIPVFNELERQDEFCRKQAEEIENALLCLPGATYDQLLAAMLLRKASHFRVAHSQPSPKYYERENTPEENELRRGINEDGTEMPF